MGETGHRLILLRHAEVASHRGDIPITADGNEHAERTGVALSAKIAAPVTVMFGGTRRSRETAEGLVRGFATQNPVAGPHDTFALRNPDLYLAGTRVNMVSSPEALAEQVPSLTLEDAAANPWWQQFFRSRDRIGWWFGQHAPPGESAADIVRRMLHFTTSLEDPGPTRDRLVIGVTHSPLLRAVLQHSTGTDPGEPAYITGVTVEARDGNLHVAPHNPLATN